MELQEKYHLTGPKPLGLDAGILVIDDQSDLRLIVVHHLRKVGYKNIHQAKNGLEALDLLKDNSTRVDILICDMDMKIMNGLDLLRELRDDVEHQRLPFCLTMNDVDKEKIMYAVEVGVDEILAKPYTLGDIVPKVKSCHKIFYNPKNPEQVYEIAKGHLRTRKPDAAEEVYKDIADLSPERARPVVGLAHCAWQRGDTKTALTLLDRAAEKNENFVPIYNLRGLIFARNGQSKMALKAYKKAIDLSPLNPLRYRPVVDLMRKEGNYQGITDLLTVAMEQGVDFPELYQHLSQAYYSLKQFKEAVRFIKLALGDQPDNIVFLNQLAIAYKESGQFNDSIDTYNKVIKKDPANLPALFNKAILYNQMGKTDDCMRLLARIVKKFPQFPRAKKKLEELKAEQEANRSQSA